MLTLGVSDFDLCQFCSTLSYTFEKTLFLVNKEGRGGKERDCGGNKSHLVSFSSNKPPTINICLVELCQKKDICQLEMNCELKSTEKDHFNPYLHPYFNPHVC